MNASSQISINSRRVTVTLSNVLYLAKSCLNDPGTIHGHQRSFLMNSEKLKKYNSILQLNVVSFPNFWKLDGDERSIFVLMLANFSKSRCVTCCLQLFSSSFDFITFRRKKFYLKKKTCAIATTATIFMCVGTEEGRTLD